MADRVVLHVGTMKSGTTYIQSTLFENKAALAEQGVLVPGAGWGEQVRATLNALGREKHPTGLDLTGAWERLAQECRDWQGTAVISVELLGPAGPKQIQQIVESFGDAQVDVVLTVRDLNRNVAAMWQETIQNGRWWTWTDYIAAAEVARPRADRKDGEGGKAGRTFWRQQNAVRLARRWGSAAGRPPHVVTVPHPGAAPDLLLGRFAEAAGFDGSGLRTGDRANAAVGAASAQLLRRMNDVLADRGLEFPAGMGARKHDLAKTVLAARAKQEPKIGLPVAPWVEEQSTAMVRSLRDLGVVLHGDWADLEPVPVPGIDPTQVSPSEELEAAAVGHPGLREILLRKHPTAVSEPPVWSPGPTADSHSVDAAAVALADLVDWSIREADYGRR